MVAGLISKNSVVRNLGCLLALLVFFALACGPRQDSDGEPDFAAFKNLNLKPGEICLTTHYTEDQKNFSEKAVSNHRSYAQRYGYQYQEHIGVISGDLFQDPGNSNKVRKNGLYWQKVTAVKSFLSKPECRYVMWLDSDVIYTNFDITVESIIKQYAFRKRDGKTIERHLFMPSDETNHPSIVINNGVFIIKNSPWGRSFMENTQKIYAAYKDNPTPEQDAFQDVIYQWVKSEPNNPPVRSRREYTQDRKLEEVAILPQRVMDSFYREAHDKPGAQWQPCDYIAHLSALSGDRRASLMDRFFKEIPTYQCHDRQEFNLN